MEPATHLPEFGPGAVPGGPDLYEQGNLREQTEHYRLILRELLARWGFYENRTGSTDALETLRAILENGGRRFRLAAYPKGDIEMLARGGLVVRDGAIGCLPCESWDHFHLSEAKRGGDGVGGLGAAVEYLSHSLPEMWDQYD